MSKKQLSKCCGAELKSIKFPSWYPKGTIPMKCEKCGNKENLPIPQDTAEKETEARVREERNKEIAKLIENIVFNHITPELEKKLPIRLLRNMVEILKS